MIRSAERTRYRTEWRGFLRSLASLPPSSIELAEAFHTQWHVCHHFLRELVDDDDLLLDVAWVWLPRYQGPSLDLFRGENIDRFDAGRVGSAWSDRREMAEVFASGLNAIGQGGAILYSKVPAASIIAGPSAHSLYLEESEFTIDTRKLEHITVVARFAPSH